MTDFSAELTPFTETDSSKMTGFSGIGSVHAAGGGLVSERDLLYGH